MSSAESDEEEGPVLLQSVSNYYFEDDQKEPISFSILPIRWSEREALEETKVDVFLRGTSDGGLLTIHKPVIAWKFDISNVGNVEISVLTKDKLWLTLEKPKKSFEHVIRSILVSIHCLHCVRKIPGLSEKSLWDQLCKTFSSYEEKPSSYDLVDHYGMINEAVKRDPSLAKSKFVLKLLEEKPTRRKSFNEDDVIDETEVDESDEDKDDPFDSVCAFCDNGGELLCCDGKCLRSFHPTVEAGEESQCESLGLSQQQVSDMQSFVCKNCECKQYQCFACGRLGAFDHPSGSEVFRCANATCGHFYHPHCVAKLLHSGDGAAADDLAKRIIDGESFACPIHKCCVCNLVEDKKIDELQFAVCRRCPKSYHQKCLPREIVFEDEDDEDTIARAWNDLLPDRALIYCLEHEIDDDLRTPIRDHIKFPDTEEKKTSVEERGKHKASVLPLRKDKVLLTKKSLGEREKSRGSTMIKAPKQLSRTSKEGQTTEKHEKVTPGQESVRRMKAPSTTKKPSKETVKSSSEGVHGEHKASLGDQLFQLNQLINKGAESTHPKKNALVKPTSQKSSHETTPLDHDSEKRLLAIMEEAAKSITLEQIINKHKPPSTHSNSLKAVVDKITMGKIEVSTEAVQTAIRKLEQFSSIEDAKAVCGPDILNQILKWQNNLKLYLAPFIHGMRYTSFGRHFTKVEKLEEVVDKLHWYVEDGDMIVDFCCGANDFSVLMSKKLEEEGKRCSYKNFDAMPPQKYFNYEQRDWMGVKRKELPDGSKLVIGLNPPFGVKAYLANKFINKALEFKPKLLILIVPRETESLDKKRVGKPYELIWEDQTSLSGKSFYLPGSVDAHDKAMDQWNVIPPPLYLWSRADWAAKHKAVAKEHGHLSMELKKHVETGPATSMKSPKERSPRRDIDIGEQDSQVQAKNQPDKPVGMVCSGEEKPRKGKYAICGSGQAGKTKRKRKHGGGKQDRTKHPEQSNDPPRKKRHGEQIDRRGRDVRLPVHDPLVVLPTAEKPQELPRCSPSSVRSSSYLAEVDGEKGSQHFKHIPREGSSSGNTMEKHQDLPCNSSSRVRPNRSPSVGVGDKSNRHTAPSTHQGLPRHSPSRLRPSPSPTEGIGEKRSQGFENKGWSQHFSYAQRGTSYGDRGSSHMNNDDPYPHGTQTQSINGCMERHAPHRPYTGGLEREYSPHTHARLYGQGPDISAQRSYMAGSNPGYGHIRSSPPPSNTGLGMAPESSFGINPPPVPQYSTLDRYAPRLDQLNHTMMGNTATRPPMMSNNYDPRVVPLDPRAPQPGFGDESMGFAPGPHNPQSRHSSAGWLNE